MRSAKNTTQLLPQASVCRAASEREMEGCSHPVISKVQGFKKLLPVSLALTQTQLGTAVRFV